MALTVVEVKSAKPKEKAYKLSDERGLYLLINPNGSKLWKLKYSFAGIEKKLSLGAFPAVSLSDVRNQRDEARKQLANNIDPGVLKNSIKRSKKLALGKTALKPLAASGTLNSLKNGQKNMAKEFLYVLKKTSFLGLAPDLLLKLLRQSSYLHCVESKIAVLLKPHIVHIKIAAKSFAMRLRLVVQEKNKSLYKGYLKYCS